MAKIIKEITVDVAKRNLFQAIVAKQHDSNSRFLKVTLTNEGTTISVDTNSVVTINASRADGLASAFAGVVNADGTVTVPLTTWMLELDDLVKCDITVIDSESRKLTSTSFELEVETAAYGDSEIMEDENYDLLVSLLGNVANVTGECQRATEAADIATANAEDATSTALAAAENASGVASHLPTISANGYWMLWDAEKGVYVETTYYAGSSSGGNDGAGKVESVNGKTGAVNLTAGDVGAVPCQYSEGPDGATYELAGHIDMGGHKINRLGDPAAADDAVTKAYVDGKVQEAVGSGAAGEDGGYYAPSVDSGGNLTWAASKAGMPQVSGANIKGPKGDTGQQGPAGADGTPITWQGDWVASNVYAKNDAVSYDGSAWVMTEGPVVGAVPGVDSRWALMARKGADGGKGVGIASIARTSGTGAAGTTDTYTITLTDGSTSTFTVYNGKDGASGSGSSAVTSVNGKTGNVELPVSGFGTCATAASTAIKVVDGLPEDFLVQDGAQLCVKFSNANTAAMPKLSVAGASATIFDARTSYNVDAAGIGARTHHFVYFSGIWVLLDAIQIPVPTRDDHGKFLRVSGHAYVLEALTDVSEVGA